MPSLEVVSPVDNEVTATYSFDNEPGATVSVSGFHGTQTYTLSAHDSTLVIRFTAVTNFVEAGAPVGLSANKQRAEAPEGEEGAEESDAEQAQREAAEAAAAANDKKGKDKKVTLVDDQGTARTYTFVEEEAPKKAAPQPTHAESTAKKS